MLKQLCVAALLAVTAQAWGTTVDINTASSEALQELKGIGPSKARAIVEERDAHGPYRDADDLHQRVRGFGLKTIERLRAAGLGIAAPASAARAARARPMSDPSHKPRAQSAALHYNRLID
jgi:competence protein ComEA